MALCEFSDEYEEIVLMTQRPWPKLKAKLTDPAVGKALQDYLFTYGESNRTGNEFEDFQISWAGVSESRRPQPYWMEYVKLSSCYDDAQMKEMIAFEELQRLVD